MLVRKLPDGKVSEELQSSNVRNRLVKTRFFLQPSHSALNTPASKNLGRATSESLLRLFLSPTFFASLTHPLGHKIFQAEAALRDTHAQDKRGPQPHLEACRCCSDASNCNDRFPTEHEEERFPYLITGSHLVLVFLLTLDSVTQDC